MLKKLVRVEGTDLSVKGWKPKCVWRVMQWWVFKLSSAPGASHIWKHCNGPCSFISVFPTSQPHSCNEIPAQISTQATLQATEFIPRCFNVLLKSWPPILAPGSDNTVKSTWQVFVCVYLVDFNNWRVEFIVRYQRISQVKSYIAKYML
jgi:hypothetical protein